MPQARSSTMKKTKAVPRKTVFVSKFSTVLTVIHATIAGSFHWCPATAFQACLTVSVPSPLHLSVSQNCIVSCQHSWGTHKVCHGPYHRFECKGPLSSGPSASLMTFPGSTCCNGCASPDTMQSVGDTNNHKNSTRWPEVSKPTGS